jgi:hypothetical protein
MRAIMNFPIIMSSKNSKLMKKSLFILLCTSDHNHYINWGNTLFAHYAPFINMTMEIYILLLLGNVNTYDVPNTYVKSFSP